MALMGLFVLISPMVAQAQAVDIGGISELNGTAEVVRDKPYDASLDFAIQQDDEAITKNGRLGITFLDDSQVKLTEYSSLKVTKYIYNPDPNKSEMGLKFTLGTARFITGQTGKINKQNIKLSTPTAEIAVLGSSFSATVDEIGRTLVINLPYGSNDQNIGVIEVLTAGGVVRLTQPFEATTVSVFENPPSKPVVLDLTLDVIDNMLIVKPPKAVELTDETQNQVQSADILDFNGLDIDYLAEDFLEDNSLEFTELDINYLDVNFLEDLLDIIDALDIEEEQDQLQLAGGVNLSGTNFGQDTNTQITTFINDATLSIIRSVSESARVDVNTSGSYTVIFIQDGISRTIKVNGGGSTTITIRQSSG